MNSAEKTPSFDVPKLNVVAKEKRLLLDVQMRHEVELSKRGMLYTALHSEEMTELDLARMNDMTRSMVYFETGEDDLEGAYEEARIRFVTPYIEVDQSYGERSTTVEVGRHYPYNNRYVPCTDNDFSHEDLEVAFIMVNELLSYVENSELPGLASDLTRLRGEVPIYNPLVAQILDSRY